MCDFESWKLIYEVGKHYSQIANAFLTARTAKLFKLRDVSLSVEYNK